MIPCAHLRQMLPGVNVELPCAFPDCSAGSPGGGLKTVTNGLNGPLELLWGRLAIDTTVFKVYLWAEQTGHIAPAKEGT